MITYLWADATFGTLAASVAASATTASVSTVQGIFPNPSASLNQAFTAVINPNTSGLPDLPTTERVTVTNNSSGNFTLTALVHNHLIGEQIIQVADATSLAALQTPVDPGSLLYDRAFLR